MDDDREDWSATASLLRGVLSRVERRISSSPQVNPAGVVNRTGGNNSSSTSSRSAPQRSAPSRTGHSDDRSAPQRSAPSRTGHSDDKPRLEFERIFGYKPDVSQSRKRSRQQSRQNAAKRGNREQVKLWRKETVCLRFKDQTKAPDTEEKMALAKSGLGLKELSFSLDGDSLHIHDILLDAYDKLSDCGGYSLHRLGTNSSDLMTIEPPRGGITVRYLKDIVKSAKLYVRPLQEDIICIEDSNQEVCIFK